MPEPLIHHTGIAAVLMRPNIDTDAIIPSREMKTVGKTGLADGLFAPWRYIDAAARTPNPDFVLNHPGQQGTSILVAGPNFGCGSSREHAVWALKEYGIKVIIAESFGAIFAGNCIRNGLLPAVCSAESVASLAALASEDPKTNRIGIDIRTKQITSANGISHSFPLAPDSQEMLLTGLDAISRTMTLMRQIDAFEAEDRTARPWAYQ
jgi:3-isopropylmalate/(R)-2-methylmalate dehydratase small subunit